MPPDILFDRIGADGSLSDGARAVAEEVPIAIELNGIGYAVLMATAGDLEDLGYGFVWSERMIDAVDQVEAVDVHRTDHGVILRLQLAAAVLPRIHDRVRHRTSESSCGLCGLENLEQAMRPLPRLPDPSPTDEGAIFDALSALSDHQPLNRATGGVHAAALCAPDGSIRLVREDVGRHNGFDKLVGAMLRQGLGWDGGFGLLSSRCSYELVEKAVLSACPTLVTISAPTTLALRRAAEANLRLYVLARTDSLLRAS
ncbi:MAG: formate dehydrogenase accessory sulfurtransferase FdhD [Pseudomonadota bacterium]